MVPRGRPSQLLRAQPARLRVRSGSRILVLDVGCSPERSSPCQCWQSRKFICDRVRRWPPLDTFWRDENYPPPSDWQAPAYGGSSAPTRRRVDKLRFPKSPRRRHIKRAVFESTASPPQGSRVQFQPFNRSRHPSTRRKEGNMRVQDIVRNACPICGKEITLAAIEPHPTHSERELHTYRCVDCGPVKTTSVRPRSGGLTRAA